MQKIRDKDLQPPPLKSDFKKITTTINSLMSELDTCNTNIAHNVGYLKF